jgi:hypothetical protein
MPAREGGDGLAGRRRSLTGWLDAQEDNRVGTGAADLDAFRFKTFNDRLLVALRLEDGGPKFRNARGLRFDAQGRRIVANALNLGFQLRDDCIAVRPDGDRWGVFHRSRNDIFVDANFLAIRGRPEKRKYSRESGSNTSGENG